MNLKALPKLLTVLSVLFVFTGIYAAKALSPPLHHSWLPESVGKYPFLKSHSNAENSEVGGKSVVRPHSSQSTPTNGLGATLLREPRQGTVLSFVLGEQDSSIGEPSWLFLLGTCLLGSAAALFHKMRA
jgi:hypothetical protein